MKDIRTRFLSDDEARRLYESHPTLGRSYTTYCPTCDKTGTYRWRNDDHDCDCETQLALAKHYYASGIGKTYQTLSWEDLDDDRIYAQVRGFVENPEYVRRGRGLILTGSLGSGKTMVATLILKQLVRQGYTCYSTLFSQMIEMYTAGWRSNEERKYFNQKVVEADVLLLDDVGRELRRSNALQESTFDSVLRSRVQNGRSTLITTNMTLEELGAEEGYGSAILSLLREKSQAIEVQTTSDYRGKVKAREEREIQFRERRPIV